MSVLFEMLRPSFLLHHALFGSVVVGFVCPLVGVYFLLRRLVLWGVALPQVSAAGIAFAFMLQGLGVTFLAGSESQERHLAIVGALLFTAGTIFLLSWLEQRGAGMSEGRLGEIYALASAATILFLAWNAAGETEMLSLLKGEIVSISESDFHAMLNMFGLIAVAMLAFQREFTLVSYDRDMAVSLGRRVQLWDALLFLIVGVTVSLGVMTVGPLVIFGLLVLPPMAALPWARGMMSLSLLSSGLGGAAAFFGFYFSYRWDLPLGPVIVVGAFAMMAVSEAAKLGTAYLIPRRRP